MYDASSVLAVRFCFEKRIRADTWGLFICISSDEMIR